MTFRLDDLLRVPDDDRLRTHGYRYLLPVRFTYRSVADEGHAKLRYSFMSFDRSTSPPHRVAGEYGTGPNQTRRLVHYPLDPETSLPDAGEDGISRPLRLDERGVAHTQGVVVARGRYYLSVSRGRLRPGTVYAGRPGAFRRFGWATPMGPEDLAWWPSTDELWSVTEHPWRRWVFSMRRGWFDG